MSNASYRPRVTEGDPNQPPAGCNITQSAGAFSENQPTAAERAEQGQQVYAYFQQQNRELLAAAEEREKNRREEERMQRELRRRRLSHKDIYG